MNFAARRRHPLFTLVLVASAAAVAAQGWLLWRTTDEVRRARIVLTQRQQERDWLAAQTPALSAENAVALADDVTAAERNLAALRSALAGRGRGAEREEPPARPTDAYFALASTVEKLRALAARQQVVLRPDESFGFATHANEGPESDALARVHLQRVAIEHLVSMLLEARPRALLGVQRERPVPEAQRLARLTPAMATAAAELPARTGGVPADFFALEEQLRLRRPGLIDTEAFRLEFTGQTQTLRAFFNQLVSFHLPLIVRSVKVEAVPAEHGADRSAPPVLDSGVVSVVHDNFSTFVVVLEFIEVLSADPTPATP